MNNNYTFNSMHEFSSESICEALEKFNPSGSYPIFVCIGSDLILGDSLGPLVGTLLRNKKVSSYVYGTLNFPITAKEVEYAKTNLKLMHPNSKIIAIDAAVGIADDVGLIKVFNKGLKPGLGVNKNLGQIGDISIIGIVAAKSLQNYNLYNLTRLNLIYKMAERIADGIMLYLDNFNQSKKAI